MNRAVVHEFGGPEVVEYRSAADARVRARQVRVRITHASLGSTDALARRGGYLLQPFAGFTPGYDFVGEIETTTTDAAARGLTVGMRVAACLPRMGAHATFIDVPPRLLVPVPARLSSEVAAALPLDLVTAGLALSLTRLPEGRALLVQGASGPVGGYIAQQALAAGHPVLGTASPANRDAVESLGATWIDYRDPAWVDRVRREVPGGVGAAVDHTGSPLVRQAVSPAGTVVRVSFVGRRGRERRDTFTGSLASLARSFARPGERIVSVPLFVAAQPARYRALLADQFDRVARGELRTPVVEVMPLTDVAAAHARLDTGTSGRKLVLAM